MDMAKMFRDMTAIGWIVISVMGIMSMYSLWVVVERYLVFRAAKNQSLKLLGALSNVLTKGDYQQAIDITKKYKDSHLAKVIGAGLLEFEAVRRDKRTSDPETAVEAARQGMDRTAMITIAEFKENLGVLATIGATAPFVGLFGTVVGIIHAFTGMATSGGGIASVSAGIAEALFTTAGGLLVAIPAVWAYNYFQNRVDRFTVEMSNSGSEMAIYFMKEAENEKASMA
ncbi:MAG: outer rane transport energization protein ExbB [Acidobacteria bacterium]|jgi:biopolymer transport protein ExbB/biopolymer transport protein TolQ|nr:outer rane transport energization protein ExbB [Acidobacteriota bacterium]